MPDSDQGERHERIVLFFDANIPNDLEGMIEARRIEVTVIVLHGEEQRRSKDKEILKLAETEAQNPSFVSCTFLITADRKFKYSSKFSAQSPLSIVIIGLPKTVIAKERIADRVAWFVDGLRNGKIQFSPGSVISLPDQPLE